jgi:oxalate decarboxylase/phosphoglucose isomerase-like protein (cupin superfamily)
METDPLNEVRNIRRMISAECDDDPKKVFEYYLKHQEESKRSGKYRFVNTRIASVNAATATEQSDERER